MLNAACAIITDKKSRFLLQLRDENALFNANKWGFFGGLIKLGEKPKEALIRELKEELEVDVKNPKFFCSVGNLFFFKLYVYTVELTIKEPVKVNEGKAGRYFDKDQLNKINIDNKTKKIIYDYIRRM